MNYHEDFDRISKSMLSLFLSSPLEYQWTYLLGKMRAKDPTKATMTGSAVHSILLQRMPPADCIAVYDETCFKKNFTLNPKPAAAFRRFHSDKIVMKQNQADMVLECCKAVYSHPLGQLIMDESATFEQPVYWECPDTGLSCRCKPDFFFELPDRVVCYDLKTTERIRPDDFSRVCKSFRYWLQDAHYTAGLQASFGKPVEFVFWAIESKVPYRIARYEYDEASRETFREFYRRKMIELKSCYVSGVWQDDWTRGTNNLVIQPWDLSAVEEELDFSGVDDEE